MENRIFTNLEWEEMSRNEQVVLCGFYHRYWNEDRTRNQAFDMFSGKILDVKGLQNSQEGLPRMGEWISASQENNR